MKRKKYLINYMANISTDENIYSDFCGLLVTRLLGIHCTDKGLSLNASNWLLQSYSNHETIIINLQVLKMPEYIQKQMQAPFL